MYVVRLGAREGGGTAAREGRDGIAYFEVGIPYFDDAVFFFFFFSLPLLWVCIPSGYLVPGQPRR